LGSLKNSGGEGDRMLGHNQITITNCGGQADKQFSRHHDHQLPAYKTKTFQATRSDYRF